MRLSFLAYIAFWGALSLFSAEDIFPWSESTYCRLPAATADSAPLPPQIDRALCGTPLTIQGKRYDRGIGLWIGGSLVWELRGKADSLVFEIGVDDEREAFPGSGSIEGSCHIYLDGEKVRSLPIRPGPPGAVTLDLRGKERLMLWCPGVPGKNGGSLDLVNLQWRMSERQTLIGQLEQAAQNARTKKINSPHWESLPDWKKFQIRRGPWNEFSDACFLQSGDLCLVICPEFGGRLMAVEKAGMNLLMGNLPYRKADLLRQAVSGDFAGGHSLRFEPVKGYYPMDVLLAHGSSSIAFPEEGVVVVTTQESTWFGLRFQYEIRLLPDGRGFELIDRVINTSLSPQSLAAWSLSRFQPAVIRKIHIPQADRSSEEIILDPASFRGHLWVEPNGDPSFMRMELISGAELELTYTSRREPVPKPLHYFRGGNMFEVEFHTSAVALQGQEASECCSQWLFHEEKSPRSR